MRRYDFNDDTSLKSTISATRTIDNRYYRVEASDRQSLLASDKTLNEPTVLPSIFYEKTEKGWRGNQKFRTELSAVQLDNDQGHDMARWSGIFEVAEDFDCRLALPIMRQMSPAITTASTPSQIAQQQRLVISVLLPLPFQLAGDCRLRW